MPKPRKKLISLEATPYYHCTSRCVRHAFLCGVDEHTNTSYEHRREWVEQRILLLAEIFSIDICAYAVMHNHYHVVLHINTERIKQWDDRVICTQWHQLYKGTDLSQRFAQQLPLTEDERALLSHTIQTWREQLVSISWFMRALNEPIARQANAEDQCTGKFWESRFYSQALLDEKALAACMAYVDLNPVRARINKTPETSEHTSIKKRINTLQQHQTQPSNLIRFVGNPRKDMPDGLPFKLEDYLNLVDWTGRHIQENKRGHISQNLPSILERLNIDQATWTLLTTRFEKQFQYFVGSSHTLKLTMQRLGYQRTPNIKRCRALLH